MSLTIEGLCIKTVPNGGSKEILFNIMDIESNIYTCLYEYEDTFPLKVHDMVNCRGDYIIKIIDGKQVNVFFCKNLTARYEFDLYLLLINSLPYQKYDNKLTDETDIQNNVLEVNKYYRESTDRIMQYCQTTMGSSSNENIYKMFNYLYNCIETDDRDTITEFGRCCFKNPDYKKIKSFLKTWYSQVLFRPLQLLGLTEKEIKQIHIPLQKAYEIAKRNPYRLPQIPLETAERIVNNHLRLSNPPDDIDFEINHEEMNYILSDYVMCGQISRMIYNNVKNNKWTSTPLNVIESKFPVFQYIKEDIKKYYFCNEEFDSLYFEKIYDIEVFVSNFVAKLYKKSDVFVTTPIFTKTLPSEEQIEALVGSLSKWISIIYGGPGTGKTFILSEIIRTANMMGKKVLCLAFTGAATTRIKETTKENNVFELTEIFTINMAITLANYIIEQNFRYVVIDEISMVSTQLISKFFSTFKRQNFQYIFIGDENQLEPIEWGNFMKCLNKTPVTKYRLTKNYRSQDTIISLSNSLISKDRISKREHVEWNTTGTDYRFLIGDVNVCDGLISYYASSFKYDAEKTKEENIEAFSVYRDSFTIISPYSEVCVVLNQIFQKYFMAIETRSTIINDKIYYVGDRVMKLVNDYGINVMNGEQGKILHVTSHYVVCIFRNDPTTITPYISKDIFVKMRKFVKEQKVIFNMLDVDKNNKKVVKTSDEIRRDVLQLKEIFLPNNINTLKAYGVEREYIELYFELLQEYPHGMCNIVSDSEFLNIEQITLSYALTTHKSQGSQYENVIFLLNGKHNPFVTINNVYTAISRAKKHLDVISTSIELINEASLNKQRYVYDNLGLRINTLMPPEDVEKLNLSVKEELPTIVEESQEDHDVDLDFDIGFLM